MAERLRVGRGEPGLKGRPKLRKDIHALSDVAKQKRKKKLEATVADNQKRIKQGKKARTISQRDIDRGMGKFRTSKQKIRRLQGRAANLRVKANVAKKAGHHKAATTYQIAANELLQQIPALRKKGK